VKPKTKIQAAQVQWRIGGPQASGDEDINLVFDQGKPRCIPSKSLSFRFETLFIILFACTFSLYELYDTVDALRSFFPIILVTIAITVTCH
jgi:hypothetical protein